MYLPQIQAENTPKPWLVASVHGNQERLALEHLSRQNYETYCPMMLRRRSHARRVDQVARPLFPGYLFIHADPACDRWRPILSTVGVRSIVLFGQTPGMIDDAFIHSLRLREKDGLILPPENHYHIGQKIRMSAGPFDGMAATVVSLNEKHRLVVLMNILQSQVRVKVRADQVAAR
jgi:transcriptional antiterminator RfaH